MSPSCVRGHYWSRFLAAAGPLLTRRGHQRWCLWSRWWWRSLRWRGLLGLRCRLGTRQLFGPPDWNFLSCPCRVRCKLNLTQTLWWRRQTWLGRRVGPLFIQPFYHWSCMETFGGKRYLETGLHFQLPWNLCLFLNRLDILTGYHTAYVFMEIFFIY